MAIAARSGVHFLSAAMCSAAPVDYVFITSSLGRSDILFSDVEEGCGCCRLSRGDSRPLYCRHFSHSSCIFFLLVSVVGDPSLVRNSFHFSFLSIGMEGSLEADDSLHILFTG